MLTRGSKSPRHMPGQKMEKGDVLYTVLLPGYSSRMQGQISVTVPLRYQKLRVISIDYGQVSVAAVDMEKNEKVTIHRYQFTKDIRWLKQTWKLLQIRKRLDHPNIVKLIYCYSGEEEFSEFETFYLVTESMDSCLQYVSMTVRLAETHRMLSQILHLLLRALAYLHSCDITLRTMNTGNVLTNFINNYDTVIDLKLIGNPLISQVAGYVSPECLLNKHVHNPKTDSWLVGCVFGELLLRKSLFSFYSQPLDLFSEMLEFCERPPDTFAKKLNGKFKEVYEEFTEDDFGAVEDNFPENCFPCADLDNPDWNEEAGMDLLSRLLCIDPDQRISVEDALNHPYMRMWNKPHLDKASKNNCCFSMEKVDSLFLSYQEWRAMFYHEVKTLEIGHPLFVRSLHDVCLHSISEGLSSIEGADSLLLPPTLKLQLRSYMSNGQNEV